MVALGRRGWPVGQCTMGLVVMVIVRTGLQTAGGGLGGCLVVNVSTGVRREGGRGLTTLRSFFYFWDLGVHLNGPLASVSI